MYVRTAKIELEIDCRPPLIKLGTNSATKINKITLDVVAEVHNPLILGCFTLGYVTFSISVICILLAS